jgi:hypothetical protein
MSVRQGDDSSADTFYTKPRDRQRGLLKSKIERHLRDDHGLSRQTISVIMKEAFATD